MENNMNPNNGQFNANNGQFNQNNGQFNANNGQFNQNNGQFGGNGFNQYRAPIRRREIALCIIFTLLTCGIYGIYWMIVLNDEVNSNRSYNRWNGIPIFNTDMRNLRYLLDLQDG